MRALTKTFTLAEDAEIDGQIYLAGRQITMAVNPSDVTNQTEVLDTYLGGYTQFGFGADLVSPIITVKKTKGQRRDFAKENAFERVDTRSGRNGAINEIDHASALTSYATEDYALATYIPFATESDAEELYNVRQVAGENIMNKLLLDREYRVWNMVTTLANWDTANRTSITTNFKWDNGSTKNPRRDIQARIKASAQTITNVYMNPDVAYWLLSDAGVVAYMRQMLGDNAPSADIAAAAQTGQMGIQTFVIPGIPPITIVPGKMLVSGALDWILGDDVVLASSPPGLPRDGNRVSTMWTFRHNGRSGTGVQTNEYIPQGRGINSGTMLEAGFSDDDIMGSAIAGGLIKDVLS
jgi:hypothetical protein